MTRIIGPAFNAIETAQFIETARSLTHVRWRHQGRDACGVDCAGLVVYALQTMGRPVEDALGYGRLPYRGRLEHLMRVNLGDPLPKEQMRFGDVVLMHGRGSAPSHCGILTEYVFGGFAMLHAYAPNREVIEHRIDQSWIDRIVEVYRP